RGGARAKEQGQADVDRGADHRDVGADRFRRGGRARVPGGRSKALRHRGALDRRGPRAAAGGRSEGRGADRRRRRAAGLTLMKFVIAAVGKVKDRALREAIDEYLSRVRRYVATDEIEIADGPADRVRAGFERAARDATAVALEVDGQALSSEAFARMIER